MVLTPALMAICLDSILSPMASIECDLGPMNLTPRSSRTRAKDAFSLRKPYPGCTACEPDRWMASRMRGTFR
jgi:hypothetical protein